VQVLSWQKLEQQSPLVEQLSPSDAQEPPLSTLEPPSLPPP
jgi:hypothetical protein